MSSNRFETPFFIGLMLLAAAIMVFILFPYLGALALAVALAILFGPVYKKIKYSLIRREGAAAFITVFLAIMIILGPVSYFGYKIFDEAQDLYRQISLGSPGIFVEFIHDQINNLIPWADVDFNQYFKDIIQTVAGSFGAIFSKIASTSFKIFLALFAFYYFLKDGHKLKKTILRLSPLSLSDTDRILSKLTAMANSVIKGSLLIAFVQGFLIGLGFLIVGLPNPVFWGSVAVVVSLIPMLGAGLVAVPAIISLFLSGHIASAIILALWTLLLVSLADNFLRPMLIERDVKVHPMLVFFSVIGGLALFGPTGLLLGPLALSFFLALLEIYPSILKE